MLKGRVKSRYWSTKRLASLPQGPLLEVVMENGQTLIAHDPLGCAEGELVLVTTGSVAARYFEKGNAPVDAIIVGSLDES
jgi:ethanolamine utilization protein EutN